MAVAGAGELLVHLGGQFKVIIERVGEVGVQCLAVSGGDAGDVVEGLGAALDLQAVHARLADEVNEGRGAHIVCVEDVAAILVLADLIELAGTVLLAEEVLPAAGLGALAAVGVAAGHVGGQQAPARDAHAHGTVHEGFDLQFRRGLVADGGNVLQGHLAGQHHALCAQIVGGAGGGPVGDTGLGGHVHVDVRRKGLAGLQHAQVCHDEGIHTGFGRFLDGLGQTVGFLIGGQGVHGQVDFAAAGVGVDDALRQLLRREIGRGRAHAELRQAAVNSVRAVVHGVAQAFQVARRGEQFRDLQHIQIPLFFQK